MLSTSAKLLCLLAIGMGQIMPIPDNLDTSIAQNPKPTAPLLPSYQNGDMTLAVQEEYQKAGANHDWHITVNARHACLGVSALLLLLVGSAWCFGPE